MAQKTLVVTLSRAQGAALEQKLGPDRFEFRAVPHALFSAKGEGVVATFYGSGKLVVQGGAPELFVERYVGPAAVITVPTAKVALPDESPEALIGSDEVGKGDYFGPLVVVAVRLEAAELLELRNSSVRDSKTLSDEQCTRLGAALRGRFPHAVERLDPPRYNQIYVQGKLNDLLASLHAAAITKLARPGIRVLVDQFASAHVMQAKLRTLDVRLEQRTRAESNPAVAAASIIAREQFLLGLKDLEEAFAIDLHKGAGDPVDRAARNFVALHGEAALAQVAKLHFKNTQKVCGPNGARS